MSIDNNETGALDGKECIRLLSYAVIFGTLLIFTYVYIVKILSKLGFMEGYNFAY